MREVMEHPVRVSRNGNSQTLTIPADIVDREHIELGEVFVVETRPDGLFYRRVAARPNWQLVGEGRDRHVIVGPATVSDGGSDPAPRPSLDWDY